jgi:hypothetical protein
MIIYSIEPKITLFKSNSGPDTPLPDLNIVVTDDDVGKNAEFDLVNNTALKGVPPLSA